MSARQMALEALKLLDPQLLFENWENGDGDEIHEELRTAAAALQAEIAQVVAPVDCQFQGKDGRWNSFLNEQHKADTIADGTWPIRTLYAAPQAVNAELLDAEPVGLRDAIATALASELAHDTYDCTRVWSAWQVGTMGEDDFSPIGDRLDEIVETVISAIAKAGGAA